MKNNPIDNPSKSDLLKKWLGLALIALSFIFYGGLFLVPFVPFSAGNKIIISSLLISKKNSAKDRPKS